MAFDAQNNFPFEGDVAWIGLRPGKGQPMQVVTEVWADCEQGLIGDCFHGGPGAKRQVTLIQAEHLPVVARLLRQAEIDPALLRRNIHVRGMNLTALRERCIRIGDARLRINAGCPPCARMEQNLGPGGYQAMCGHGGAVATVLEPGMIRVGDPIGPAE